MAAFKLSIAGINKWTEKSSKRSVAVVRRATRILGERIIEDAPVDTGFMVASARVRLNPGTRPLKGRDRPDDFDEQAARAIKVFELLDATNAMRLGDSVGLSFVANYTKYVHNGVGQPAQPFIAQNLHYWPSIMKRAIAGQDIL
jgi:hypothetical protein